MSGSMMHLRSLCPGHPVWAEEAHADVPDSSPLSPKSCGPSPTPFPTVSPNQKQSVDSVELAEFKLFLSLQSDLVSIS